MKNTTENMERGGVTVNPMIQCKGVEEDFKTRATNRLERFQKEHPVLVQRLITMFGVFTCLFCFTTIITYRYYGKLDTEAQSKIDIGYSVDDIFGASVCDSVARFNGCWVFSLRVRMGEIIQYYETKNR